MINSFPLLFVACGLLAVPAGGVEPPASPNPGGLSYLCRVSLTASVGMVDSAMAANARLT